MKFAVILSSLALITSAAQAQDIKLGAQITVSKPQGDLDTLMDGRAGLGIGAHLFIDLDHGHALVPRVDYVAYERNTDYSYGYNASYDEYVDITKIKAELFSIGVDYNYFFSGRANKGLYVAAGVAYVSGKLTVDGDVYDNSAYSNYSESASDSETKTALGYSVGGGFMFNPHMGVEVKYHNVSFDTGLYGYNLDAPSVNASFIYRF
jgi:hypothetical protein